jgi:phospholipase/carboxylesterase
MIHVYEAGPDSKAPTLLLLHGTGGTERDLFNIGRMISNGSSLLGVKGNVSENGMARFFRRVAEGVFDEKDLIFRTQELHDFLNESAKQYGFDRDNIVAVGYSNGANIAASLLFHFQDALKGAVLFHPMVPRRGIGLPDLNGVPVFIGAGENDPLCDPQETKDLAELLTVAKADVHVHWENNGHQLSRNEVDKAAQWFQEQF